MNTYTEHPQLDAVDMSKEDLASASVVMLVEQIMSGLSRHRIEAVRVGASLEMDNLIISALSVCAGVVHGELLATGQVTKELDPEALRIMLTENFAAGVEAGKNKAQRYREQYGCGDPGCTVCDGVAGSKRKAND